MGPLVKEFDQRSLTVISDTPNQVRNVVTIEAAGRCQHNEVISPLDQVRRFHRLGLGDAPLLFGDKLEVVVTYVEYTSRRAVLDGNGHPPLRGDQSDVANGSLPEKLGIAP